MEHSIYLLCTVFRVGLILWVARYFPHAPAQKVGQLLALWFTGFTVLQVFSTVVNHATHLDSVVTWRYVIGDAITAICFGIIANRQPA